MSMDNIEFLKHMAKSFDDPFGDPETDGIEFHMRLMAQVAKEILERDPIPEDAMQVWDEEQEKRWKESKFFKLWQEERAAGRNPEPAFAEKGWQP